jgi:hypothetical protein
MNQSCERTAQRGRFTPPEADQPNRPTWPASCSETLRMPLLASGSRRAATSGCEGREAAGQTVKEYDRRSI